jgi:hypothetical protein
MSCLSRSAARWFFGLYLLSTLRFFAADAPAGAILGDGFTVVPGQREASSDLNGQRTEVGGGTWATVGHVFIKSNGTASADTESMAIVALPHFDGALDLSADLLPHGSDFTALVFMPNDSMGDFWKEASLWVFVVDNGHYEIRAKGMTTVLKQGEGADYPFQPGVPTHVEVIYDPTGEDATVKLNGVEVLTKASLPGLPPISHVGFRFNGKVTSGQPEVGHFAVTPVAPAIHLQPASSSQFYITPDRPATLQWNYSPQATGTVTTVTVRDYQGKDISQLKAVIPKPGELDVPVQLPPGYYSLFFPEVEQEFGLVVLPAFRGKPDPFFGMDAALSELTPFEQRESLIAILQRGGIGIARERLGWGQIEPSPDAWDWEAAPRYETTRQLYQKAGVGVLDLFAGAPSWMEKSWTTFPHDLITTEKAWETIGGRFQPYLSGLEAWNEPDTVGSGQNEPADQYLPIVKAIHYAFHNAGIVTPLGGGVFAYDNKPYLDLAARNGLLEQADFLSFHYYGDADNLLSYIQEYRAYLERHGNGSMPLWITEMGPPWVGTPGLRAPVEADTARGLKFARNAVEARAGGIARIFPFVLVDYSEQGTRIFGMLDAAGTPLRPMGTYLEAIQMLAGTTYIGDLKNAPGSRVFQRDAQTAVIAYTANGPALPTFPGEEMRGIDGRLLTGAADGLTYLTVPMAEIAPLLDADTPAMKLYRLAAPTNPRLAVPSPLVLMPSVADPSVAVSNRGYQLAEGATSVPLRVRVVNFGKTAASLKLTFSAVSPTQGDNRPLEEKNLTVPPEGDAVTEIPIQVSSLLLDEAGAGVVQISGPEGVSPAAVCFIVSRGLKEQLSSHPYQFALPIAELARWKENSAGQGSFSKTDDGGWAYDIVFHGGDQWAYPRFTPPQEVDPDRVSSVLIRARCAQPAEVRLMVFDSHGKEFHTPFSVIKADGQWHVSLVPLDGFIQPVPGQKIGRQISALSVGLNSVGNTNRLEVSDLYLLGN